MGAQNTKVTVMERVEKGMNTCMETLGVAFKTPTG